METFSARDSRCADSIYVECYNTSPGNWRGNIFFAVGLRQCIDPGLLCLLSMAGMKNNANRYLDSASPTAIQEQYDTLQQRQRYIIVNSSTSIQKLCN